MTHEFARRITAFLLKKNKITKSDVEVCTYGYSILLGEIFQTLLLIIMGVFFHRLRETIIFIIVFVSVRRHAGGYHASTRINCIITTILMNVIAIFSPKLMEYLDKQTIDMIMIALLIVDATTIIVLAPISLVFKSKLPNSDSINKRNTAIFTCIYAVLAVGLSSYLPEITIILVTTLTEIMILLIIELIHQKLPNGVAKRA